MKDKITKFKCYFDFDKEIEFINKMNRESWKLVYIKAGCFFTFVKAQPDEYITILHADKKENLASVAAFAAQCGYENIPHTMDGVGDLMYFTGRKSEVSDDFVSDNESKQIVNKIMLHKFNIFVVIYVILAAILIAEAVLYSKLYYDTHLVYCLRYGYAPDFANTFFTAFYVIFALVWLGCCGVMFKIRHRLKKKEKELKSEQNIYE